MGAEFRENEKAELAGVLQAVKAAIGFEAANFAPGVTPSVWDEKGGVPAGGSHAAAPRASAAIKEKQEHESRQEPVTMSLFGDAPASKSAKVKDSPSEAKPEVEWEKHEPGRAAELLEALRAEIGPDCELCPLARLGRSKVVFGVGDPGADLVFVGEGPGEDEDRLGEPFVGRAGQLLTKMIEAMGLKRSDVYICNVVKCRPPKNRNPEWQEMKICGKFMERQIGIIRPKAIVALGKFSAMYLKGIRDMAPEAFPISKYRGRFEKYMGANLMPTYHPSYLLRTQSAKKDVWEDLQQVMKLLGLKLPPK